MVSKYKNCPDYVRIYGPLYGLHRSILNRLERSTKMEITATLSQLTPFLSIHALASATMIFHWISSLSPCLKPLIDPRPLGSRLDRELVACRTRGRRTRLRQGENPHHGWFEGQGMATIWDIRYCLRLGVLRRKCGESKHWPHGMPPVRAMARRATGTTTR